MSIHVSCESCFHEFSVPDKFLGKRGKCPSCGEPVLVADGPDADERPRRKSKPVKKSAKKKRKRGNQGWLIGLSAGGVLLIGVIGYFAISLFSREGGGISFPGVTEDPEKREARRIAELDDAYADYINLKERQANKFAAVSDSDTVDSVIADIVPLLDEEYAVMERLAYLGAERPPMGAPERFSAQLNAVEVRFEQTLQSLNGNRGAVCAQAMALITADPKRKNPLDLFRIDALIRSEGQDRILFVKLLNNDSLTGPRHQKMSQMLQDQVGAKYSEAKIDGIDGQEYRMVLAPVPDVAQAAQGITLGTVSELDVENRSFTLTIDPQKIPEVRVSENTSSMEFRLGTVMELTEVKVTYKKYSGPFPLETAIQNSIFGVQGLDRNSLKFDQPANSFQFRLHGFFNDMQAYKDFGRAGFSGLDIKLTSLPIDSPKAPAGSTPGANSGNQQVR
ncbi:MAG: hypothetical protein ACKVT0_12155 [Planctomycetaceae bacterium]